MTNWKDSAGREWSLHLTPLEMDRLRDASGINLYDAVRGQLKIGEPKAAFNLAWASIHPKQSGELTREQFDEYFGGDDIDAFLTAVGEEIVRFFPSAQKSLAIRTWNQQTKLREEGKRLLEQATDEAISQALSSVWSGDLSASLEQTQPTSTISNP